MIPLPRGAVNLILADFGGESNVDSPARQVLGRQTSAHHDCGGSEEITETIATKSPPGFCKGMTLQESLEGTGS